MQAALRRLILGMGAGSHAVSIRRAHPRLAAIPGGSAAAAAMLQRALTTRGLLPHAQRKCPIPYGLKAGVRKMTDLKPGDRVTFDDREYLVIEVDEETDTASLMPMEDVVRDVPLDTIRPIPDRVI